jgi:hypothetical protein
MPARDGLESIANAVEQIPLVGPLWADVFEVLFGVADAMNLQSLRAAPSHRSRDRKVVFLY